MHVNCLFMFECQHVWMHVDCLFVHVWISVCLNSSQLLVYVLFMFECQHVWMYVTCLCLNFGMSECVSIVCLCLSANKVFWAPPSNFASSISVPGCLGANKVFWGPLTHFCEHQEPHSEVKSQTEDQCTSMYSCTRCTDEKREPVSMVSLRVYCSRLVTWKQTSVAASPLPWTGLCHNTLTLTGPPRLGLCHNTLTITGPPRLGLCHNTLTGPPRLGLCHNTDTNRTTKAWAVSQHWH